MEENKNTTDIKNEKAEGVSADVSASQSNQGSDHGTDNKETKKSSGVKPEVVKVEEVNEVKTETYRFNPAQDSNGDENKKTPKNNKPNNILKFKRKNKKVKILIAVLAVAAAAAAITYINKNKLIELTSKNIITNEEYEVNSKADFYISGDVMFYVTKDGMKIHNSKTKTDITDTYTMKAPIMKTDGQYTAVAERKGKQVRVYNTEGSAYNVVCEGEIVTFSVNPTGYSAVCYTSTSDNSYTVDVYNNTGVQLSHTKSTMSNGMPVSIDLSDNGGIFCISFVNTSGLNIKSNILFYYPNAKDAAQVDNSDGMFSSFIFDNQIVDKIYFLNNNDCIALSDSKLVCYKYSGSSYGEKWSKDFGNYLTAIDFPGNNSVICGFGDKNSGSENQYEKNTAVWYNNDGNEILKKTFNREISSIFSQSNAVIIGMSKYFEAYDMRENLLWSYTSTQDVNNMQFYKDTDNVMIVTPTKMSVVNIKNGTKATDDKEAIKQEEELLKQQEKDKEQTEEVTAAPQTAAGNN